MNKGCLTPLTHSQTHSSREERGGRQLPGRGQESYFPVGARFTYARRKISRDPLCSKVPVVEVAVLCVPLRPMKGHPNSNNRHERTLGGADSTTLILGMVSQVFVQILHYKNWGGGHAVWPVGPLFTD